jgi:hypothetical protein
MIRLPSLNILLQAKKSSKTSGYTLYSSPSLLCNGAGCRVSLLSMPQASVGIKKMFPILAQHYKNHYD